VDDYGDDFPASQILRIDIYANISAIGSLASMNRNSSEGAPG